MSSLIIPITLSLLGIFTVFYTYSSIRRGGARVYTLERETILRRATSALFGSMALFLTAIGILIFQGQSVADVVIAEDTAVPTLVLPDSTGVEAAVTPSSNSENIPGLITQTPTPTIDLNIPTATPTPIVVRGIVTGTGGSGLQMRETPGGEPMEVLAEETFVTILEDEGVVEQGGLAWIKVRTFLGDEGWVAEQFVEVEQ